MLVRRARSLQKTADAQQSCVVLNSSDMSALNLTENAVVNAEQNGDTVTAAVFQDFNGGGLLTNYATRCCAPRSTEPRYVRSRLGCFQE